MADTNFRREPITERLHNAEITLILIPHHEFGSKTSKATGVNDKKLAFRNTNIENLKGFILLLHSF